MLVFIHSSTQTCRVTSLFECLLKPSSCQLLQHDYMVKYLRSQLVLLCRLKLSKSLDLHANSVSIMVTQCSFACQAYTTRRRLSMEGNIHMHSNSDTI